MQSRFAGVIRQRACLSLHRDARSVRVIGVVPRIIRPRVIRPGDYLLGANMKRIFISDTTLCRKQGVFSFKERLEIARRLEKLGVNAIELPEISNTKVDSLFIRTAASFVTDAVISVGAGNEESVGNASEALKAVKNSRIRIDLPVSVVGMEYGFHMKPAGMLEHIASCVSLASGSGFDVEFCAQDSTRAEPDFLRSAIDRAIESGAKHITLCDDSSSMLPDDLAEFVRNASEGKTADFAVKCSNKNYIAVSSCIVCVKEGITCIKTSTDGIDAAPLEELAFLIENIGNGYGISSSIRYTNLHRIVSQIKKVSGGGSTDTGAALSFEDDGAMTLDRNDDRNAVINTAIKLGYDLSEEDEIKVYDEFVRVAEKKKVGAKELDAIIASVAMQVPATYQLANYVINTGNIISASAQITLVRDGKELHGISIGDGSVDAAFRAIEGIIGHKYELDDFQIQAITEGKEAIGSALVKLRSEGRLYSGNGISTDIIEASIKAYISAVNKIVYEVE